VQAGVVKHKNSDKQATFGELADAASKEAMPEEVLLKDPKEFRLIGKTLPRKDSADKVNGKAIFTQDIKLPNLLTAVVLHPPRFGATLKSVDDSQACGDDSIRGGGTRHRFLECHAWP
jgi:isoquinoline 1-oxidoreductase subunit beta